MTKSGWSSSVGYVLAMAGSAVGLGNFWRFPHICGKYGGAAFILFYLAAIFLVGFPLLILAVCKFPIAFKKSAWHLVIA